jgi:hypothetical protein
MRLRTRRLERSAEKRTTSANELAALNASIELAETNADHDLCVMLHDRRRIVVCDLLDAERAVVSLGGRPGWLPSELSDPRPDGQTPHRGVRTEHATATDKKVLGQ